MTPFKKAVVPDKELERLSIEFNTDMEKVRQASQNVYMNDLYQVSIMQMLKEPPGMIWLSIKRLDKQPIHDWRHIQQIKNELVGEECDGVELYPAESRRVDASNQYHLFVCPDPNFRLPFGYQYRDVTEEEVGGSKQRKF